MKGVVVALIVIVLVIALLVILVPSIYYGVFYESYVEPECPQGLNDSLVWRSNCIPEGGATEELCRERGCCWLPMENLTTSDRDGPPSCFFPSNYGYKLVGDPVQTNVGWYAFIERINTPAMFGDSIDLLKVEIEMQTVTRLRIKVTDGIHPRYEVPIPQIPVELDRDALDNNTLDDGLYNVTFQPNPFGLQVTRKSTGSVIFDTTVAPLIFSKYFLQLSTSLASHYIYGLGENKHERFKHDINWKTWGMFAKNINTAEKVGSNKNGVHPIYLCIENVGYSHGVFLHNSNAMEVQLQPAPALTFRTIGGMFDFYIYMGPTPEQVHMQHTTAVGRTFMPPYWALGFHLGSYGYNDLEHLARVVTRTRNTKISYDAQHTGIDYMHNFTDFTYDNVTYRGFPSFIADLHKKKQRFVIVLDTGINVDDSSEQLPYVTGESNDVFIKHGDQGTMIKGMLDGVEVAYPDFGKRETQKWFTDECQKFHKTVKFDGIDIDRNEPESEYDGSTTGCDAENKLNDVPYTPQISGDLLRKRTLCMDAVQHWENETYTHYDLHNLYGLSSTMATSAAMTKIASGKRGLVVSRSTYPGSGKFGGHWIADTSSNWSDMRTSVIGMLEFSLFGIPFVGADICGFRGNADLNLCQRWMQLGAFYPFSRNNNHKNSTDQDPGAFPVSGFEEAVRTAMQVRYTLLPYLYTLFYQAHNHGSTVVRPLLSEFPNDPDTYDIDEQFMWGRAVLVSPTLHPNAQRVRAYFPPGRWYDYFTAKQIPHAGWQELAAPKENINVHFRGGHIVPAQVPGNTTEMSRKNPLRLFVALSKDLTASGMLFWDDGVTKDTYQHGRYLLVTFRCEHHVLQWKPLHNGMTGKKVFVGYIDIFGLPGRPTRIFYNNVKLKDIQQKWFPKAKFLRITHIRVDIETENTVRWSFEKEEHT